MRYCVITRDNRYSETLRRLDSFRAHHALPAGDVFFTGYRWPDTENGTMAAYPIEGRSFLRTRAVCSLLQAVEARRIPASSGSFLVGRIRREIVRTVLGLDPDIVVTDGLLTHDVLKGVLAEELPGMRCLEIRGRMPAGTCRGAPRRYDPGTLVSIVLPTYNGSKYLADAIESCLNQTHRNLEVILVDDASTDATGDIARSFNDPRLRIERHAENRKLPAALNTGFALARGEYLTWTSDDNRFAPDAVEEMVRYLQTYGGRVDFVYAEMFKIDAAGSVITQSRVTEPSCYLPRGDVVGACFLFKRSVYEAVGEFNPLYFMAEDYEYWLRVHRRFSLQLLRRPLYYYRVHGDSLTGRYPARIRELTRAIRRGNLTGECLHMKKISVIIATHNYGRFIAGAVTSVLRQGYGECEIIVVDDGSTDDTFARLAPYRDRIAYICQRNGGSAHARNTGIRRATGEYIAFLDADDVWLPEKLERSVAFLEKEGYDWTFTSRYSLTPGGALVERKVEPSSGICDAKGEAVHLECGLFNPAHALAITSTVVLRRTCLDKAGLFDPTQRIGEDLDLWLRLKEAGLRGGYLDEPLTVCRWHAGSLSHRDAMFNLSETIRVAKRHARILGLGTFMKSELYGNFWWEMALISFMRGRKMKAVQFSLVSMCYYPQFSKILKMFRHGLKDRRRDASGMTA